MMIIFFDGVCGFCNRWVDFLLPRTSDELMFSPLQGNKAKELLSPEEREDMETLILWVDGVKFKKSRAVFKALSMSPAKSSKLLCWLNVFPAALLDMGYNMVAKNRYKIFGRRDTCRLPTKEERHRFLD